MGQEAVLRLAGIDPLTASSPHQPDGPVAALADRARAGDGRTLEALATVGRLLGVGLASYANLFNPQAIVLGGFFSALAPWLTDPVERELETRVLSARWSPCRILAARLAGDAAVRGAAALSLREVLADPASVGRSQPWR